MTLFWTAFMDGLALRPVWKFLAKQDIDAAIRAEREGCAQLCEAAANVMESKTGECDGDADEIAHLRSTAWLLSVCANRIRTRSNAKGQGGAACGASPAPTGCASNGNYNERTDK